MVDLRTETIMVDGVDYDVSAKMDRNERSNNFNLSNEFGYDETWSNIENMEFDQLVSAAYHMLSDGE